MFKKLASMIVAVLLIAAAGIVAVGLIVASAKALYLALKWGVGTEECSAVAVFCMEVATTNDKIFVVTVFVVVVVLGAIGGRQSAKLAKASRRERLEKARARVDADQRLDEAKRLRY